LLHWAAKRGTCHKEDATFLDAKYWQCSLL
jgi:hypothetical protein